MAARRRANSKRAHERKRKAIGGLKRNGGRPPFGHARFVIEPLGREKLSEVLHRFVAPYERMAKTKHAFSKTTDRRCIVAFELQDTDAGFNLSVVSTAQVPRA
jgi:hypothetical protein